MAKKLLERFGNTKTRTLFLLGAVIFIVVILIVVMTSRKPNPLKTEESHASKIPQITAIPGNVTSEKYQSLQEEDNRRRAEEAKKTGGSAVATIIGSRDNDALSKKETFGIEGDFLKGECKCGQTTPGSSEPNIPDLDPDLAAKLIAEIEKNPQDALRLMKQHPGLAKSICHQKPDLALKIIENNKEAARIMLNECPAMAKVLAEKNPEFFKQLMLESPALAKKLAASDPELFKAIVASDPAFLKKLLLQNPELAKQLATSNPEIIKNLMAQDPEFAKQMATRNPDVVKDMLKNDPDFTEKMAKQNPEMIKDLMKADPEFAKVLAKNNPAVVKKLILDDPEFAKIMAKNSPEMIKGLMVADPEFANALAKSNPTIVKELMKNDPAFADIMGKQNPDMVKKLMLDDPEFAKTMARNNPDMVQGLMDGDPAFAKALRAEVPGIDDIIANSRKKLPFLSDKERIHALDEARRKQKDEQAQRARQLQLNEQQQKQVAAIITNMENQSKAAFQAWNEISPQVYVKGDKKDEKDAAKDKAGDASGSKGDGSGSNNVLIKAGTILFAVLDTAINTDEPSPVMATVTFGDYKGAKALGDLQLTAGQGGDSSRPEKVVLNFTTLSIPGLPKSTTIKGVAIDPDTARTALASDVDHHYLLRYGTLLASSFMTGYSKVISSQGTVQTNTSTGNTTTTTPPLNGRQQIFAALGEVGKRFGEATSTYFNSPNTIKVEAGTGIGLLILSDVTSGT